MKARYQTMAGEIKSIEDKLNPPNSPVPINKEDLRRQ